jgi:hypothetical protein
VVKKNIVFSRPKYLKIRITMKRISTLLSILSISIAQTFAQSWLPMGSGLGTSTESVKAIAESPSHELYAGGNFTGGSGSYLAKWNGSSWDIVGTGVNGPIYALICKNNEVYVGGAFTSAGGVSVNNFAKWSGGVWSDVGGGFNDQVNCIYVASDPSGTIYAGGRFSQSGTNTMNHVSKLVSGVWTQVGTGISSVVNSIAEYGGSVYAGTENVASPVSKFDGSSWSTVSGISGGKVYALASFSGYLYAGGDFSVPTFAASKYNGTSWSTIQTTFGSSDKIYALSPRFSTVMYIGGKFSNLGIPGSQSSFIARINSPITPIQSITVTSSTIDGEVYAIGNLSGKVIAGGKFANPATNIAITSTTIGVNELSNIVVEKNFFPNPVHGSANLVVTTSERLKNPGLQVFDLQSRLIDNLKVDQTLNNNSIEFKIDCSDLARGNYYYLLTEDGQSVLSDKFVVE